MLKQSPDLLSSESTWRRRFHELYGKNGDLYSDLLCQVKAFGFDERKDKTIQAKGPDKKESHITFTGNSLFVENFRIVILEFRLKFVLVVYRVANWRFRS